MKIACYGFVAQDSGSVAIANFLIMEELLRRGHEIHFFRREVDCPLEFSSDSRYQEISIPDHSFWRAWLRSQLPQRFRRLFDRTLSGLMQNLYSYNRDRDVLQKNIENLHQKEKYDLILFLGLFGPFKITGIPTISWVQAPPYTEWRYIQKLRKNVITLCGWTTFIQFKLFYLIKDIRTKTELRYSDYFICCSKWAKEQLINAEISETKIKTLPYPIDLDLFQQPQERLIEANKTFLWLGRIDPRKRLDLLLDAYRLLLDERRDVHLKIVGASRHTPGYKKLIDSFELPTYLSYQEGVDRAEVPALLGTSDVLIQPSEGESFGSSTAEALCCGIPVILGPTNGTQDYTGTNTTFLFEEYSPESLKEAMLKALDKVDSSHFELAEEARRTAKRNFSLSKVVDELEVVLQLAHAKATDKTPQVLSQVQEQSA